MQEPGLSPTARNNSPPRCARPPAAAWRRPELRAELDADPRAFLAERGMEIPPGPELKIAANTAAVFHLVMPADPNDILSDEALARISGGTTLRRETSTISSLSSLPSTVSSASTVREHYN